MAWGLETDAELCDGQSPACCRCGEPSHWHRDLMDGCYECPECAEEPTDEEE